VPIVASLRSSVYLIFHLLYTYTLLLIKVFTSTKEGIKRQGKKARNKASITGSFFFDPEEGGNNFLRNISQFLQFQLGAMPRKLYNESSSRSVAV